MKKKGTKNTREATSLWRDFDWLGIVEVAAQEASKAKSPFKKVSLFVKRALKLCSCSDWQIHTDNPYWACVRHGKGWSGSYSVLVKERLDKTSSYLKEKGYKNLSQIIKPRCAKCAGPFLFHHKVHTIQDKPGFYHTKCSSK